MKQAWRIFIGSHTMKSYSCFYVVYNINMSSQHFPHCTLKSMIVDVIRVQNNCLQRKSLSPVSFDYFIKLKSRVYSHMLNVHLKIDPCFPWEKNSQFLLYTLWSKEISFFNNLFSGLRKQIAKLYIFSTSWKHTKALGASDEWADVSLMPYLVCSFLKIQPLLSTTQSSWPLGEIQTE